MIPKNIFQSWHTLDLHPIIQKKIEVMKEMNPEYTHKIYTDNDMDTFVNTTFPGKIAECYNRLNIIVAKVDFWRYLILFTYGGVYLDMDSSINISLDTWIQNKDEAIITAERNPNVFVQWALIFNKGHPILKKAIQLVVQNIMQNKYPNDIHKMTGPSVFSQAVNTIHTIHFGRQIRHHLIHKHFDMTFTCLQTSYRIYGIDFNGHFTFKNDSISFLYDKKKHWREEEKEKKLLRD
jgi:mannosyltransferase OCH1-like enzyme